MNKLLFSIIILLGGSVFGMNLQSKIPAVEKKGERRSDAATRKQMVRMLHREIGEPIEPPVTDTANFASSTDERSNQFGEDFVGEEERFQTSRQSIFFLKEHIKAMGEGMQSILGDDIDDFDKQKRDLLRELLNDRKPGECDDSSTLHASEEVDSDNYVSIDEDLGEEHLKKKEVEKKAKKDSGDDGSSGEMSSVEQPIQEKKA